MFESRVRVDLIHLRRLVANARSAHLARPTRRPGEGEKIFFSPLHTSSLLCQRRVFFPGRDHAWTTSDSRLIRAPCVIAPLFSNNKLPSKNGWWTILRWQTTIEQLRVAKIDTVRCHLRSNRDYRRLFVPSIIVAGTDERSTNTPTYFANELRSKGFRHDKVKRARDMTISWGEKKICRHQSWFVKMCLLP